MKRIYKFPFPMDKAAPGVHGQMVFNMRMPTNAALLDIKVQDSVPTIWALVDPDAPIEQRTFEMYATGNSIDTNFREHLATLLFEDGQLVFHIFEVHAVMTVTGLAFKDRVS